MLQARECVVRILFYESAASSTHPLAAFSNMMPGALRRRCMLISTCRIDVRMPYAGLY